MIAGVPYDAEVEYLESTDLSNAWIDTGLSYFPDFEIEVKVPQGNRNITIWCNDSYVLERFNANRPYWSCIAGPQGNRITSNVSVYERHVVSLRNSVFSIDGNSIGTISNRTFGSAACYMFYNMISHYKFILYRCKLWDSNGTLVRNYVAVRVGQIAELYDRVTRKFAERHGTFNLGPDVAKPVMGVNKYGASRYGIIGARNILYRGA